MSKETFKELEEVSLKFGNKLGSEVLFKVFLQVAKGQNYVTKIARELKKSKAIVSRQLKQLVQARLIRGWGEGVKQTFQVDWEVFSFYWIYTFSPALSVYDLMAEGTKTVLSEAKVPEWMADLYLTSKEWKSLSTKGRAYPETVLEGILFPVIPDLARIVEMLIRVSDSEDFSDAFMMLSRSFAIGLPDLKEVSIGLDDIKDERTRQLLKALYSEEVRLWLKVQVFNDVYSANIVRNFVVDTLMKELDKPQRARSK